jgi:5-methyltetrahydrofolate--homocysteine methyltransferase
MPTHPLLQRLQEEIVLFDGAIGTQVQVRGLKVGEAPEVWNLERPDAIREVHNTYIEAGAGVVTTNTFGGSRLKLDKMGLADKTREINVRGAALARETAPEEVLVAGSVGPTGDFLEPLGTVSQNEMRSVFLEQVQALLEGGADLIIVETMTALEEAMLAVEAALEAGANPVIASMTFDYGKQGFRTMMGVSVNGAVQGLESAGAHILGSNCGAGIEDFIPLIREMRSYTNLPLLAEPNAGLPRLEDGRTVYDETPEIMAGRLPDLVEAGAGIVGGCCGTTPDHIRRFRQKLKAIRKPR